MVALTAPGPPIDAINIAVAVLSETTIMSQARSSSVGSSPSAR
jgi:hypothetical protein